MPYDANTPKDWKRDKKIKTTIKKYPKTFI
jgi:hypothetical protein